MDSLYVYFIGMIIFVPSIFYISFKLKFQELFDARKTFEIKIAYVILSLCIAHILASIMEKFYLLSNI
ncbi:MAG: hypothetical protein R3Y60_00835 [bacterium]